MERAAGYIERSLLEGRHFKGLEELNAQLRM
jgi:hypothetical protein